MLQHNPLAPDLEIFVSEVDGDPRHLSFRASAADPRLGFGTFVDYGQVRLRVDPSCYLDGIFSRLQPARAVVPANLENVGVRLFEDLLPFELRRRLWRARSDIRSIFVVTAEAWIPWELLKLQDPEGHDIGSFFAESFALGRWFSGAAYLSSAAMSLPMRHVGLIFPADSDLPHAQDEKQDLLALAAENRQIVEIPARREAIAAAMARGTFDCWHFCGHGEKTEEPVEPWYLHLESDSFDPKQLHGRARRLGQNHPLVFLNTCHGGRAGEGLTGLGGLPASFVQVGAGAFIGPLWEVTDRGAACFARAFYRAFLGGATLGASVLAARKELRDADELDSTWLAYILIGHPSAACSSKGDAVSPGERAPRGPAATRDVFQRKNAPGARNPNFHRVALDNSREPGIPIRAKLAAVAFVLAGILAGTGIWRIPTLVRLEGRASRISAYLGSEGASLLGDGLVFAKLTVAGLAAAEVSSSDPADLQPVKLETDGILFVTPTAAGSQSQGALRRLSLVKSQRVLWEAERWPNSVALRLEGTVAEPPYEIVLPKNFALRSSHNPLSVFERNGPSVLRLFPALDGLVLDAELPPGSSEPHRRLLDKAADLSALSFTEQRAVDGTLRSTILDVTISYPDAFGFRRQSLASDGVVLVDPADSFRATVLELDPERGEIVFAFEGKTSRLLAGTAGNLKDLRLSALETYLREICLLLALAAITVGIRWRRLFVSALMTKAGAGEELVG